MAIIGVFAASGKITGVINEAKTSLTKDIGANSKEHDDLSKEHLGLRERLMEILHATKEILRFTIQENARRQSAVKELDPIRVVDQVTALASENMRLANEVIQLNEQVRELQRQNALLTERASKLQREGKPRRTDIDR